MSEMERGKEKMTFVSWGTFLTKFKGKVKDDILFIKLPKITIFLSVSPAVAPVSQHEIGGCVDVMAERQAAED